MDDDDPLPENNQLLICYQFQKAIVIDGIYAH